MKTELRKKGKRILAVVLSLLIVMGTFDYGGSMEVNAQTKNEKKIITAIADLDSSVTEQTLSIGAQESDIQLPETLQVTVETISEEPETEELETEIATEEIATETVSVQDIFAIETVYAAEVEEIPVTWELDTEYSVKDTFDGGVTLKDYFGVDKNGDIDYASASQEKMDAYEDMNGAYYTYRAVLPEGYTPAEGLTLPRIYVQIGESQISTMDETSYGTQLATTTSNGVTVTLYSSENNGVGDVLVFSGSGTVSNATGRPTEVDKSKVKTVVFEGSVTGGTSGLQDFTALENVSFSSNFTSLGKYFFYGCTSLQNITLPDGVEKIPEYAFGNCTSLTKVEIPDSVTSIEQYAFIGCTALIDLEFGDNPKLENLVDGSFWNCTSFGDKDLFTECMELKTVGNIFGINGGYTGTVIMPPSITDCSNFQYSGISELYLPDGAVNNDVSITVSYKLNEADAEITKITKNKSSATTLTLPETLFGRTITSVAKEYRNVVSINCTNHGTMDNAGCVICGHSRVGDDAHYEWDSDKKTLSILGTGAMYDQASSGNYAWLVDGVCAKTDVEHLIIADGITAIGARSFADYTNLADVAISENSALEKIGKEAFSKCSSLTGTDLVDHPKNLTTLGEACFYYCGMEGLAVLPPTVTEAGSSSRPSFSSVQKALVLIPATVATEEYLESYYGNCLTYTLDEENKTASLSVGKLSYYSQLTEAALILPEYIGDYRISSAPYAEFQTKGMTLTHSGAHYMVDEVCQICGYTTKCGESVYYSLEDGVLTLTGSGAMYDYVALYSEGTLPPWNSDKDSITKVVIGKDITTIGKNVFRGCTNLQEVVFDTDARLTTIGNGAFMNCTSLSDVIVPETVTTIRGSAFQACSSARVFYLDAANVYISSFAGSKDFASYQVTNGKKYLLTPLQNMIQTTNVAYTGEDVSSDLLAGTSLNTADIVIHKGRANEESLGVAVDTDKWVKSMVEASCISIGTYHVQYTGLHKYNGSDERDTRSVQAEVQITKGIGAGSVTLEGWTYGGTPASPVPVSATNGIVGVTYFYKAKSAADDTYAVYNPSGEDTYPTQVGTYTLKAVFAGTENYTDAAATCDFVIAPAELSADGITITPYTGTYDGKAHNTITGVSGVPTGSTVTYSTSTDYNPDTKMGTWSECSTVPTIKDAGTLYVRVKVTNPNYEDFVSAVQMVTVSAKSLQDSMIGEINENYYYTGEAITLGVTVTDGTTLKAGTDYNVTVTNNTAVHSADGEDAPTVTIEGIGNYKGTITKKFAIVYTTAPTNYISGTAGNNDWYTSDVTIKADEWTVSEDGTNYYDSISLDKDGTYEKDLYFKNAQGQITDKQTVTIKIDKTAPTGKVQVGAKWWDRFWETISFGKYHVSNEITITADDTVKGVDSVSGVDQIYYLISDVAMDKASLENSNKWTVYSASSKPTIAENSKQIVYAKLVDKAGNTAYISSDGVIVDTTPPEISNLAFETGDSLKDTQAAFSFQINEEGSYYYVVLPVGEEGTPAAGTPIAADIIVTAGGTQTDGNTITGAAASGTGTVATAAFVTGSAKVSCTATGLLPNHSYKVYVVAQDDVYNITASADGTLEHNTSAVSGSEAVTTKKTTPVITTTPALSGTYGMKVADMTFSGGEVKAGDIVITGTWSVTDAAKTNVPTVAATTTYQITFTPGKGYGDYAQVTTSVTPEVAKRAVTVTAVNKTKTYNTANPELTFTVTGGEVVTSDTVDDLKVTLTTTAVTDSPVGTYPITGSGADDSNYDVTITPGTLTIYPAEGTLSINTTSYTKTYGTAAFSVAGENIAYNAEGTLQYEVVNTEDLNHQADSSNISVITVDNQGQVTIHGTGSATINVSVSGLTNYTTPAAKAITVTVGKAAAQTIPAGTKNYSYSGGSRGNTETVNVAEKVSAVVSDAADCSYLLATSDANNILSEVALNTQTGALSYKVPAQASDNYIDKTATLTVTIASANYEDMTYTQTVKLTEKSSVVQKTGAEVAISGSNQLTYGQALGALTLNTGSAKFVEDGTDTEVEGKLEWTTPKAKPGVKTTAAEWTFTPDDPSYEVLTGTLAIKVVPAEGTVSNKTTGGYQTTYTFTGEEITAPQSSNFDTNSGSTGFTYTWYRGEGTAEKNKLEGTTRPSTAGTYTLKVDAAATENYTAATTTIKVTISSYTCGDAELSAENPGDAGADGWYHGTVLLTAPDGHTISTTQDKDSFGTNRSLEISGDQNGDYTYYLKQDDTGYITVAKTITVKIDTENPTGSIGVKQTWWQTFLTVVTFGLYTNEQETVTISAKDEAGSVNSGMTNGKVEYYISQTPYESIDNLKGAGVAWSLYDSSDKPTVSENATVYIYARITDTAGNVGYVSTQGIMYDNQKPTVTLNPSGTGYTDQAGHSHTYQSSATVAVAVSDTLSGIDTVSCTLNGNTVAGVGNGSSITVTKRGENTLIVTATDKAGNVTTQTLTVRIYGAAPTITITPADSIVYDGAVIAEGTDFTLNKDGSAGTVTYFHKVQGTGDETYVSGLPVNAGNYTIKAVVAEDSTGCYQEAEQTADLTITKAQPTVTLNAVVNRTGGKTINLTATVAPVSGGAVPTGTVKFYDTTTGSDGEISAETLADGTAACSYTGLATQIYKIKAVYEGNANYTTASSAEQSADTAKQNQEALSIQSISAKTYGDAAFELAATGGSGTGDVTFTSSDESVLSISGTTATIHKAGTVTITAVKAADDNYNEAAVQTSVTIGKKALTITADDRLNVIRGSAMPTFTYTTSGLVNGDTITGAPTMTTTAADTSTTGTYVISITGAVLSNPDGYAVTYKAGTLTIVDSGTSDTPDTTPDTTPTTPDTTPEVANQITTQSATSQPAASQPTATPADTQAPFIEGKNGEQGWDVIKSDITDAFSEALEDAGVDISAITDKDGKIDLDKLAENPEILEALSSLKEPLSVTVNMNGSTELPADIISLIAGKNIDLTLELEEGISWTINGNSVTGENFSDIDLAVTKNSTTIPVDIINEVSGESYTMQIELSHNGEFGFTATLTINLESKNAGCYANLFYFNEETETLEFMGYGQIDEDGNAELEFTHASAYTIVITEEPMDEEATAGAGDTLKTSEPEDTETSGTNVEAAGKTGGSIALWIILGLIAIVIAGGIAIVAARKKEENE